MLSVNDLSLNFGGLRAVDGVSFTIETGRIHGLIGPNGAGKTTIFNCVTGFYRPTSGSIRFLEHDITRLRPDQIARLGIAHVPERAAVPEPERRRQRPGGEAQPHADGDRGRGPRPALRARAGTHRSREGGDAPRVPRAHGPPAPAGGQSPPRFPEAPGAGAGAGPGATSAPSRRAGVRA